MGLYFSDLFLREDRVQYLRVVRHGTWACVGAGDKVRVCVCGGQSLWPAFPTGLLSLSCRAEPECQHSVADLSPLLETVGQMHQVWTR